MLREVICLFKNHPKRSLRKNLECKSTPDLFLKNSKCLRAKHGESRECIYYFYSATLEPTSIYILAGSLRFLRVTFIHTLCMSGFASLAPADGATVLYYFQLQTGCAAKRTNLCHPSIAMLLSSFISLTQI